MWSALLLLFLILKSLKGGHYYVQHSLYYAENSWHWHLFSLRLSMYRSLIWSTYWKYLICILRTYICCRKINNVNISTAISPVIYDVKKSYLPCYTFEDLFSDFTVRSCGISTSFGKSTQDGGAFIIRLFPRIICRT